MALTAALRASLATQPLALGGAPLGNLFRVVADADASAVIRHAYARGVRCFDTAPHYGNGLSEQRFGTALHDLARESYVLSTKVGRLLHANASAPSAQHAYVEVLPFVQSYDYSRAGVLRSLEASLQRLTVDRIDIVYVHDLDRPTHGADFDGHFRDLLDGGLPALAALKAAGAIGGYGIGVNGVGICTETLRHADLDAILLAGRYTLADQSALATLLPECARRNVGVILGGPYNSGILASGAHPADGSTPYFDYAPAESAVRERVSEIEDVCRAHAVPLKAAALQFPRAHPAIAVVLVGARTVAELDENVAMMRHPIPPAFWTTLRARGLIDSAAPLPAGST